MSSLNVCIIPIGAAYKFTLVHTAAFLLHPISENEVTAAGRAQILFDIRIHITSLYTLSQFRAIPAMDHACVLCFAIKARAFEASALHNACTMVSAVC